MSLDILVEKLKKKEAKIGVVGLGYVGLPLSLRLVEVGFYVYGLDIDSQKVKSLNDGKSYIAHIPESHISNMARSGRFKATSDYSKAKDCDALIICVPTPLTKQREPDISFIIETMNSLAPFLRKDQILSLESTTYPGTTDEVLKPYIDKKGLKVGEDFFLVFSPEREDPGNPNFITKTIPKVCGGYTPSCQKAGVTLYSEIVDKVVPVSSTRAAELTKLLENIHRAVNIGLVNEMKIVADRMGLDIHEVIRAASSKPFGFVPYYPGPGLGGHCIPIDPFYLTWKAREFGLNTRFIELAGEVNTHMPHWVIDKVMSALNDRTKSLKSSKVLVLGIAYKKNIDDMRESPSVELMEILKAKGALVDYSDPLIPVFPKMREHYFDLKSVAITPENIKKYDCVLLATNHDKFDYAMIKQNAALIVDSRGVYLEPAPNIVKA
ncbi:MAG: nucleotide sugar dehydrogenase [Pseudomonadota bacterium]|nr:nucleotide sugar dehydrogenase [Pseudomonadota bacterium]